MRSTRSTVSRFADRRSGPYGAVCAALLLCVSGARSGVTVGMEELDISRMTCGWAKPVTNRNVRGGPMQMGGRAFERGVGTHAESLLRLALPTRSARFCAWVGVDDAAGAGRGSVEFRVLGDGRLLWSSGRLRGGEPPRRVELTLGEIRQLVLRVTDGGDGTTDDLANWAEAIFELEGGAIEVLDPVPEEPRKIRTPPRPRRPCFRGAAVVGARPGRPFTWTLPLEGERPLFVRAAGLPEGLVLDESRGRISGRVPMRAGRYEALLVASNAYGVTQRRWRLEVGERLALTPPMGWNSWNCYGAKISQAMIEATARAMAAERLQELGWTYIVLDDGWQRHPDTQDPDLVGPERDPRGRILPNRRFPDMSALVATIRELGFKAGIYSSPGPITCAGHTGSHGHESEDAEQFAEWGFEYLKYDWCSYSRIARGSTLPEQMRPYLRMAERLAQQPRDIVFSICQYGVGNVSAWGRAAGGHLWRTTGDIEDTWESVRRIGFGQAGLEPFAGPGGWNDPDMLVIGRVGWGEVLRPSRLTPNEQYAHVTLWCLLAAPLMLGCDMTQLDDFTRGLITNGEVLDVNQDPLGRAASRVAVRGPTQVWARPLADGSVAVGLFNLDEEPLEVEVRWGEVGIAGAWAVRDLWRGQDLGVSTNGWSMTVARHGAEMLRLTPADATASNTPPRVPWTWQADARDGG
ncbi:MAG: NPCBM/NEW2 domain-containing protein [Kiritimatiellae bacterium]|nr:NPCBM/NEW2 domain-containing protein [Kiritimatiellia bacterium]